MTLIRSSLSFACVAVGLGCLLACPLPARAQTFVEFSGGWNYLGPAPAGDNYANGYNVRASIGRVVAPNVRVRFDLFTSEFDHNVQFYPPCAYPGCTHAYYNTQSMGVAGLTVNGLVNIDPRGIVYVIGGAGLYDVHGTNHELRAGVSAGAGIAVPVGVRLRAVVEARWHGLTSTTVGPSWLVPITVGFRY